MSFETPFEYPFETSIFGNPFENPFGGIVGGGGGGGNGFILIIPGVPIDPAWLAIKVTAKDKVDDSIIDGFFAIGDKYVTAAVNPIGAAPDNANLLTGIVRSDYTDMQRTFPISSWILEPYIHVVDVNRVNCHFDLVEATMPNEVGSEFAHLLNGSTTYTYDLTDLSFDFQDIGGFLTVLCNFRVSNVDSPADTLFSLWSSADDTNWIEYVRGTDNVVSANLYIAGVLIGTGASSTFDYDTNPAGVDADGWGAVEIGIGVSGNMALTASVALDGADVTGTQAPLIPAAQLDNFTGVIDRLTVGARPDGTVVAGAGTRINRLLVGTEELSSAMWELVQAAAVDPLQAFRRPYRFADLSGRSPWGLRNRINGQLYIDSTGTPGLVSPSVAVPATAPYHAERMQIMVPASGDTNDVFIPEADGIYLLYTPADHDGAAITVTFDEAATSEQTVSGPRAVIAGGGATMQVTSDAGVPFFAWLVSLVQAP